MRAKDRSRCPNHNIHSTGKAADDGRISADLHIERYCNSKFPFPSKTRKEMWADSHSLYIINGKKKNIGVPVKTGGRRPMGLIAQPAMIDDGPCFSSSLSFVSPIAALDIVS